MDLEGSGDDDPFADDEIDDLYSGSGSGCKYRVKAPRGGDQIGDPWLNPGSLPLPSALGL